MSDILIALHVLLYVPALVGACWISHRRGITRGKWLGHDEAGQLWPQQTDRADRDPDGVTREGITKRVFDSYGTHNDRSR